ncbi:DUF1631 family protein [Thalassolituus maritimus]|uniref:Diguanylate cyclase (GGDEF) domain-containing protein n=1 Tax=Thalassolituus maritimus TaxID=484498 RepID=A0ABQ0A2W2_9GAMM
MSSELRKHPRFSSQVNARLVLNDGSGYECLIQDYSHAGMKIHWPHSPIPEQSGPMLLELQLSTPVKAEVDLVHQEQGALGVRVHQADGQLFLEMQEYNQSRSGQGLPPEQRQRFRDLFSGEAGSLIERLPKQWLPEFIEATYTKSDFARNTAEQQLWMKLEAQVRSKSSEFCERFTQILAHQLERWLAGEPKLTDESEEYEGAVALSLVRQSDFEDWLMAKVTASHMQSFLSQESFELRQLLDTLSSADVSDCFNPVGPNTVTEAFRDCIDILGLPHEARELAFESFEKAAVGLLKATYQSCIRQINIPITFRYRKSRPATVNTPVSGAETGNETDTNAIPKIGGENHNRRSDPNRRGDSMFDFARHQGEAQQAYANIQQLLTLRHQKEAEASGQATVLPVAEADVVSEVVQSLDTSTPLSEQNVVEQLEQQLAAQDTSLPEDTRHAIDTVEQVTRNLLNNPSMAEFVKPSVEQLGWPLLRLMLDDPSLLFNPQHPGRLIFNLLGRLGKITSSGQKRVKAALEEMIAPVLENPSSEPRQMEELVENLQLLVGTAERKVRQNSDRVAEAAEGEYRLYMAHKRVNALIGNDTSGRTLPECVIRWLQEGWQQMLCLLLLREGPDSARFKGAVKLYRQVLILFSEKNAGRAELMEKFTPLMDLARSELDQLNGPLAQHEQWHKDIMAAATAHLEEGNLTHAIDLPEYKEPDEEEAVTGKGARRVLSLQVGDMLLLTETGQSVSVAWIAADQTRYACVNHTGMRVHDYRFNELARAMEDGLIKRIYEQEETPVDQSIDKLVQQIYADLSAQANTDPLTGLINRQHFLSLLANRVADTQKSAARQTLAMINIDQFKLINKNYGVDVGDFCLQTLATILQEAYPEALCSRIGSNEFAVLMTGLDQEQAEASARMISAQVEKVAIDSNNANADDSFHMTVSIGLAAMSADTTDAADLLERAEIASQLAKEKGTNRIVHYQYDDASRERHELFMRWGNRLSKALESNTLRILCVPIDPIQSRYHGTLQYEITIAVEDEQGIEIPPQEFLQASQNYNRMYAIDRWVIDQVLDWIRANPDEAAPIERFNIRLSGRAFSDDSLLEFLTEQSREFDVPVEKLCFELNETATIHDLTDAADFMHEMRKLGSKFVLSDFGTGQSSYNFLKALPVDFVKIDRNFIDGLSSSSADYALIKSIQEIAQFMAKKTIAEHSDNEVNWEILRGLGIDFGLRSVEEATQLIEMAEV